MKAEEYASGTCNRVLVLLRYGFTLALRWKVPGVVSNPVKEIKNIKDDNKIERYLTEVQTKALLDAVRQSESEMLQYIVLFLIYTGARKREVLDARWRDIDWAQLVRSARTAGPCRHKTTSRYAHLSRERLVAAVEVVPQISIGPRIRLGGPVLLQQDAL